MKPRVRWIAGFLLVTQVVAAVVGADLWAWYHNSLEGSGRWVATKATLARRVMGSGEFAHSHHTLAGQRLDLGRWFGFQEVLSRARLELERLDFELRLDPGAYLVLEYGLGEAGGHGLRLSANPRFQPAALEIASDGSFSRAEPRPELAVAPGRWIHVAGTLGPEGMRLALDGDEPRLVGPPAPGAGRMGFRNGRCSAQIDDVGVQAGPLGFTETFFDARAFWRVLLLLLTFPVLEGLVWPRIRARIVGRRAHVVVALTATALCATLGAAVLKRAWAARYPRMDRTAEAAWLRQEADSIEGAVAARYPGPDPQKTRVLVIGTSQTWGAGALRPEEGLVEVLQHLLREARPEQDWQCINAGVSGLDATWLEQLFEERWLALEPDVLVLNLSNNDKNPEAFERALERFRSLADEHGIALVFALEANSVEGSEGPLPMHPVMRRVAERHGIALVDVHRALAPLAESGFLWWDFVHPTSLGHKRIAETLLPAVLEAGSAVRSGRVGR